jgi:hypothetical protein
MKTKPNQTTKKMKTKTKASATRTALPKLRTAALTALKVDAFNASVLRTVIATRKLPPLARAVVTNAIKAKK